MAERETCPKSLMERSKGCQELGCCLAVSCVSKMIGPFSGVPCPPFYRPRGEQGLQMRDRGKKPKVEKVLRESRVFLFPCDCPANMADRVRDGMFADPDRAMPRPPSASGCIPSYIGGRCGVPESQAVTLRGVDGEVTVRLSLWMM